MSTDFLMGSAYEPGEFERLQRRFDRAVFDLAALLSEPIERAMRATMSEGVTSLLLEEAAAVASLLQRPEHAAPTAAQLEADELGSAIGGLRRLPTHALSLELDPEAVAEEVEESAGELAHHSLALWLSALRKARKAGAGMALNANMLPGEMTMHEALHELDVDAFGVKLEPVIAAVSRYRSALRTQAVESRESIVFADDLLVAVGPDIARPYILYASRSDHDRDAAANAQSKARPAAENVRGDLVRMARAIGGAFVPRPAHANLYERLIDATLADARRWPGRVGDVGIAPKSAYSIALETIENEGFVEISDDLLAYPIEAAADMAGAGAWDDASERFGERLQEITRQVHQYCEVRHLPLEKVGAAYAVFAALRAEPSAGDWMPEAQRAGVETPGTFEEHFAQVLELSQEQSTMLIKDSTAGSRFVEISGALFDRGDISIVP